MFRTTSIRALLALFAAVLPLIGCSTTAPEQPPITVYQVMPVQEPETPAPAPPAPAPALASAPAPANEVIPEDSLPKSEKIEIPVVASPTILRDIPKRSRIVIADIGGPCTLELKNALMTRLVDNSEYDVLTRDNLEQLLLETENNWSGPFNTKTAATLGELLGASLFVVGNVVYCGRTEIEEESEKTWQYNMLAVLQILDLETGKVLMSSADQGKYRPETSQLLVPADPSNKVRDAVEGFLGDGVEEGEVDSREIEVNFPIFKAAEDLANDFADKFFSRPSWENLEMWMNSYWRYGDSIRLVKLGHCSSAVDLLEGSAARELRMMPEKHVAEYLHNYGVALLCDNQVTPAMEKLRSAFRVTYEPTTLRMLDMAAKVDEWNLEIKIDEQPEIERLLRRGLASAR